MFFNHPVSYAILMGMVVRLTAQAEEALRQQLARSPGREPAQIVEEALTELVRRRAGWPATSSTPQDFSTWLRELRQGIEPAPDLANETFRRETIYQGHD
jgi:hypothetical protein